MTDKELAEESLISYRKEPKWAGKMFMQDENTCYKDGFLAGLKAGKTQWHDLRKNPTDVPKENVTVLLLTEVEPVTARYDNKYEAFFRLGDKLDYCVFIAPMSYIAWCEIPKYTEELCLRKKLKKEQVNLKKVKL